MYDPRVLKPDLRACALEDRILPAIEFGLFPSPFLQVNLATNQIFVPGTSTSSAGISAGGSSGANTINLQGLGSNPPGPSWYFIMMGSNASGVSNGSSIGGSLSLYNLAAAKYLPGGAMVHTWSNILSGNAAGGGGGGGGGAGSSGNSSSGSSGSASPLAGYGASFSSGYGFALSGANNYGMFSGTGVTTTLGSVPVHTYGGGGDLMDSPEGQVPPGDESGGGLYANQPPGGLPALPTPGFGLQGPNAKLYEHLLGKSPAQMGPQPIGPSTGMGQINP
jgi:hypothetical protein